ncbi:hypothetical protein EDC01DRAFT_73877 [Geopyxis carbonaria]|nr:hypothetical protein EDC01DRAFT_73877 [Geopyxis carbonaria]
MSSQATPRSLRTFLDSTPLDILDHPLSTLIFVTKAEHERLSAAGASELAQLQQLQQQHKLEEKALKSSLEEVQILKGRITALEDHNTALENEKKDLLGKVDEVEAKGKVQQSEIVRLRDALQARARQAATPTGPRNSQKQKDDQIRFLQKENARLSAELKTSMSTAEGLSRQVEELRQVVPQANTLIEKYSSLQAEKDQLALENQNLKAQKEHLTGHNATLEEKLTEQTQMATTLWNADINLSALQKTNAEIVANLRKVEKENKTLAADNKILTAKNTEMSNENEMLEKQNQKLEKHQISLSTELDTLRETSEAEKNELQNKLSAIGHGSTVETALRVSLDTSIANLKAENSEFSSELRKREDVAEKLEEVKKDFWALKASYGEQADIEKSLKIRCSSLRNRLSDSETEIDRLRKTILAHEIDLRRLRDASVSAQNQLPKVQNSLTTGSNGISIMKNASPPTEIVNGTDITEPAKNTQQTMQKRKFSQEFSQNTFSRSITPDVKGKVIEKRPRIDTNKAGVPDSESLRRFQAPCTTYIVHVPDLVNKSVIWMALATLQEDIQGLRRVFYGPQLKDEEKWVVRFNQPPRDFQQYIRVGRDIYATLYAVTGTQCMICRWEHDIWDCSHLGAEGQDRPTLSQCNIIRPPNQPSQVLDATGPSRLVTGLGNLQKGLSPTPSPRSLAERTTFPNGMPTPNSGRTLFERIHEPEEFIYNSNYNVRSEIERLIDSTDNERRGLFCRFTPFAPRNDWFINIICGGRVENFKIIEDKRFAFIYFVYPEDAARFLSFAEENYNNRIVFTNPDYPDEKGTLSFEWNKSNGLRAIGPEMATGIVRDGWTRILVFKGVKEGVTAEKVRCILDKFGKWPFWIIPNKTGRDLRAVFTNIFCAHSAFKQLWNQNFCEEVIYGNESCGRPVGLREGLEFF